MIAYRTGTTIFPRDADAGYARLVGSAIKRQAGIGDCFTLESSTKGMSLRRKRSATNEEIDDGASVSGSGEGTYVQAWVWVSEP